jgi:hypothetical protein
MKVYVPAGMIKYVHVYEPHGYIDDGRKDFMVCIDAEYMKGFSELNDYFAKTPHLAGKTVVKISSRKRPEVKAKDIDLLMYELDCRVARNVGKDDLFREKPVIVEFEMKEISPNMAGYKGFYLALVSVEVFFND